MMQIAAHVSYRPTYTAAVYIIVSSAFLVRLPACSEGCVVVRLGVDSSDHRQALVANHLFVQQYREHGENWFGLLDYPALPERD